MPTMLQHQAVRQAANVTLSNCISALSFDLALLSRTDSSRHENIIEGLDQQISGAANGVLDDYVKSRIKCDLGRPGSIF